MRHCFNLLLLLSFALGCTGTSSPPVNANDGTGEAAPDAATLEVSSGMDAGDGGEAGPACPLPGFILCNGVCINGSNDRANCGACGTACADGQVCAAGACAINCGQLTTCNVPIPDAMGMDGGAATMAICADLMNDPARCGRCDFACQPGESCRGGSCVPRTCPEGLSMCMVTIEVPGVDGGLATTRREPRCVDLMNHGDFCGSCESACVEGQRCREGRCLSYCQPGTQMCDRAGCTALQVDPAHCGACRNICPPGNVCLEGRCTLGCGTHARCTVGDAGAGMSRDYCADTQSDPANCGSCGRACAGHERCEGGVCVLRCQPPLVECLAQCIDTRADNRNCGGCGRVCTTGFTCVMGMDGASSCAAVCGPPLTACPAPSIGSSPYCANLSSDRANCGTCRNACPGLQSCIDGVCRFQCPPGQTLCGAGASQVCAVVANDPAHCGACGNACPTGAVCNAGRCEPRCAAPLIGCPATAPTFCVDARYDPSNCGRCGRACDASLTCVGGSCCTSAATPDTSFTRCAGGGAGCASSFILRNGQSAAQGFTTSAMGGFLVRARLHLSSPYAFAGRAAQVYVVPGTSNVSILSPTTNVARDAVATAPLLGGVLPDWYDVAFSPPVRLDASRPYFLVLRLPDFPVSDCPAPCVRRDAGAELCECPPIRWTLADDASMPAVDPYAGGFAFSCGEACPLFTQEANRRDHAFEVYLASMCVGAM